MEKLVDQLTIERARNGFKVYIGDYKTNGTCRPVPYVFETMENLLKFIQTQLKETYEPTFR
jgi:hypothetical protein